MNLPDMSVIDTHLPSNTKIRGYTVEQMLAWGKACAAAEREACAAIAEPPPEWLLIKNILGEYGLQAIDFVAEWKAAQRKPLTDKQILADETLRYYFGQNGGAGPVSKQGKRVVTAIEAAHGIKETKK